MIVPVVPLNNQCGVGDVLDRGRRAMVGGEIVADMTSQSDSGNGCDLIMALVRIGPVRARGVPTVEEAFSLLDQGATKIVVQDDQDDFIYELPKSRTIVAIRTAGSSPMDAAKKRIVELKDCIKTILVEFGSDNAAAATPIGVDDLLSLATFCKDVEVGLEIAGYEPGTMEEFALLDRNGVNVLLPSERLLEDKPIPFADAITASLTTDRSDGLFTTLVTDEHGVALGLVYSNRESIRESVKNMRGVYHSRKRGLWYKGDSSGATQDLIRLDYDCDGDCLRFIVHQNGVGFCHLNRYTCFSEGAGIPALMRTLLARRANAPAGSYTKRLFDDPELLASKLREEVEELLAAPNTEEVAFEAADVIYFCLVAAARHGVTLPEIERNLDRRSLRVRRRPGNAKPPGWKPGSG